MTKVKTDGNLITKLFFRLLPIQILLASIGAINEMVSSLFASNSVGSDAMGAIGLYYPINMLISAICTMLVCGSQILCGKFMGSNQMEHTQKVFSTDILLAFLLGLVFAVLHVASASFGWLRVFTSDPVVLGYFKQYVLGKSIGILPFMLGQQFAAFLSLENRMKRTTVASFVFIFVNLIANYVFVGVLKMQTFGVSLAASCGLWAFLLVQFSFYLSGKSIFRLRFGLRPGKDSGTIVAVGIAGALTYLYQALRGLLANMMITEYAGSAGISAFATVTSFLGLFWAIPGAMMAVSRMLMSVAIGEEDRRTLTDIMRNMFRWCLPLMTAIIAVIVVMAEPITNLYFHVPDDAVYKMTVIGMRLMSIVMPIAVVEMHFMCYAQTSGKQFMIHLYGVVDGVAGVIGFSLILMPFMGIVGYYWANILNSAICIVFAVIYAIIFNRRFPHNMDELMAIPENFGVSEENRLDLTVRSMDEVVEVSRKVWDFCTVQGIDKRRTYLSALFLEEMAGNVVDHGFHKDRKKHHSVDIRVVHKEDQIILRIKDDCVPFNPAERKDLFDPDAGPKNMGIRIVYMMAKKIEYNNILGLNVLTIQI